MLQNYTIFKILPVLGLFITALFSQPVIDVWYGNSQNFGLLGTPQNQINILGKVTDIGGIDSLYYTLNGSAKRMLNIGPYYSPDKIRRLYNEGDYNIEIFTNTLNGYSRDSQLLNGTNTVIITAVGAYAGPGNKSIENVTFEFDDSNIWPSTYAVNWDTVTNIQNVVQVVDGNWYVEGSGSTAGIRIVNGEWGYDRAIALGNYTWENYEFELKFKMNEVYEKLTAPSFGAALAVLFRWLGHTDNPYSGFEPKVGYYPHAAFIDYVPRKEWNSSLTNVFEVSGNNGSLIDSIQSLNLSLNTWYKFKARVQSNPGSSPVINAKIWQDGSSEPSDWQLSGTHPLGTTTPTSGCILLVAHHVDATFGNFTVTPLGVLPVEFSAFSAEENGSEILLKWETSSEINNYKFVVERNSELNNSEEWVKIGVVQGNGNSNKTNSYLFTDQNPATGLNRYRIKQVDYNGAYKYSEIKEVNYSGEKSFILSQNYPNPFNPVTTLKYYLPKSANTDIEIVSPLGQTVFKTILKNTETGWQEYKWNAGNLASGIYFCKVKVNYLDNSGSVIQINKMILLK